MKDRWHGLGSRFRDTKADRMASARGFFTLLELVVEV
jgi:hypothetical protein